MDDLVSVLVYLVLPVLYGLVAVGTVLAMGRLCFVTWGRRGSRVDR